MDENENYLEWAKMHYDHDRYERASVACQIAQAMIAERQAAALERIASVLEAQKPKTRVSWSDEKKWKAEGPQ